MKKETVKYGILAHNGNYRAIRLTKGNEGFCEFTASSKQILINKIVKNGYEGYMNDGLIRGLNDGERCEMFTLCPR